jgi:RNA polymerase sigma-70 factor (ECF subfamily)
MNDTPPTDPGRLRRIALEEELLAIRCQVGEPAAFDELIARWYQPLWKYALRLTGDADAASETVQEVWLRVCRGIVRLEEPSKVRAWVFGIARRVIMDRLREKYAEPPRADVDMADVAAPDDVDLRDRIADMRVQLAKLPFVERDVLVLFYLDELTLAELADVLAVPVGTVKSRLFRARRALARELQGKGLAT